VWLLVVTGLLERRDRDATAYLIEENHLPRQVGGRRLRLADAGRRRLVVLANERTRQVLRNIARVNNPDTLIG
jgi:hypothetical protein